MGEIMIHPLWTLLFGLVLGAVCSYFAKTRGRDALGWFALGFFFGIFGLIALFIIPPKKQRLEAQASQPLEGSGGNPDLTPPAPEIAPQAPSSELTLWYFIANAEQEGPMSFDALARHFREGKISKDTFVWNEDMEGWKKICDLPETLAALREVESEEPTS